MDDTQRMQKLLNEARGHEEVGSFAEALQLYEKCRLLSNTLPEQRAALMARLGVVHQQLGQFQEAVVALELALSLEKELGRKDNEAYTRCNLSNAYRSLGSYEPALTTLRPVLEVCDREQAHLQTRAQIHSTYGNICFDLGQYERALEHGQKAIELWRACGDQEGVGASSGNIGVALERMGQHVEAERYYLQALSISRETGNRHGEAVQLGNLANALSRRAEHLQAIQYLQLALKINDETGNLPGKGSCLDSLGSTHAELKELGHALELHEEALRIHRLVGDRRSEGKSLGHLGSVAYQKGEYEQAAMHFTSSLAVFDALWASLTSDENRLTFGDTFHAVARDLQRTYLGMGQPENALLQAERARSRALEILLVRQRVDDLKSRTAAASTGVVCTTDALRTIAMQNGFAVVIYSQLSRSELVVWVVSSTGVLSWKEIDISCSAVSDLLERVSNSGVGQPTLGLASMTSRMPSGSDCLPRVDELLRRCHELLIGPIAAALERESRMLLVPDQNLCARQPHPPCTHLDDFRVTSPPSPNTHTKRHSSPAALSLRSMNCVVAQVCIALPGTSRQGRSTPRRAPLDSSLALPRRLP